MWKQPQSIPVQAAHSSAANGGPIDHQADSAKGDLPVRPPSRLSRDHSLRHEAEHTELRGTLADQSQLQGLLNRLFDLGIQLVSVSTGNRCTQLGRSAGPA
jgi:hypothetical protein